MLKRLTVLTMALGLSLAFSGAAMADSGCGGEAKVASAGCTGVELVAKSDCAGVAKVAAASGCAATCGSKAAGDIAMGVGGGDVDASKPDAEAKKAAKVGYTIGQTVEDFTALHAQTGEERSLASLKGDKATVIIFWNIECPWVIGPRGIMDQVNELHSSHKDNGVSVVLVDPGVNMTVDQKKEYATEYDMPVLINQDSKVAARFNATYTPEVFILDSDMKLVYHGAYTQYVAGGDGERVYPTHNAVKSVVNAQTIDPPVTRGQGCTIKWAPGSKPQT